MKVVGGGSDPRAILPNPRQPLRLFGIHQRFHRYNPRHGYLAGPSNPIADALSQDFSLTWGKLMSTLKGDFLPGSGYHVWEPLPKMVETVLSAIIQKRHDPECLLVASPAPQERPPNCIVDKVDSPWMLTSKPSCAKYAAYRAADDEFVQADYHTSRIPSSFDRLKVTHGNLSRRPKVWGPHIDLQA